MQQEYHNGAYFRLLTSAHEGKGVDGSLEAAKAYVKEKLSSGKRQGDAHQQQGQHVEDPSGDRVAAKVHPDEGNQESKLSADESKAPENDEEEVSQSVSQMMQLQLVGGKPLGSGRDFVELSAGTLIIFASQLKSWLIAKFCAAAGEYGLADLGYHSLHEAKQGSKRVLMYRAAAGKKLRLSMVGEVTDTPVSGCLPLCFAFNKEWYVKEPPGNKIQNSTSNYVWPARMVPAIKGKEKANVTCSKNEYEFHFSYTAPGQKVRRTAGVRYTISAAEFELGTLMLQSLWAYRVLSLGSFELRIRLASLRAAPPFCLLSTAFAMISMAVAWVPIASW